MCILVSEVPLLPSGFLCHAVLLTLRACSLFATVHSDYHFLEMGKFTQSLAWKGSSRDPIVLCKPNEYSLGHGYTILLSYSMINLLFIIYFFLGIELGVLWMPSKYSAIELCPWILTNWFKISEDKYHAILTIDHWINSCWYTNQSSLTALNIFVVLLPPPAQFSEL